MRPGYCHREAAVGFAPYCYGPKTSCNIPPAKNLRTEPRSWKRWWVLAHWSGAAKTICGTICSVGVDKSSGWDLADAKMPTVWTRTKQSRARWGARTSSMPCDGQPQEIWLDCFPSKAQDGNLTTDARMSLFPFVFLFLSSSAASQVLVKSFVLHCLTCWRSCVGRRVRALFVNLELSVPGIFTARQHNEIII